MMRLVLALMIAAGLLMGLPLEVRAQQSDASVTRSPATAPTLGAAIRGTSATTFSISTTGVVTRANGNAIRLSSASVTTPTLSINCGLLNLSGLCAVRYIRVTIVPVVGSGPATITRLRVGQLTGSTFRTGAPPAEAASLVFDLAPIGLLRTATLQLGMDVMLAANASSGAYSFDYTVTVQLVT